MDDFIGGILGIVILLIFMVVGIAFYLLPAIIGFVRKKDNAISILLLNLFLGWSLIAWVVALVWATTKDSSQQQVIIQNHHASGPTSGSAESNSSEEG